MIGVEKQCVTRRGKISFPMRRGGINIVFKPKYRLASKSKDW
jgi:hypothetical protein